MKDYPSIPRVANAAADRFDDGHLWLLEKIDGASFRFRLQQSGVIQFGDRSRRYTDPDAIPDPYRHAVRHVRERLDRDALRRAVDDVEAIVFFGEATHHHTIDYDWERLPSFLGFDIWNAATGRFYPPDIVAQIFEQVGLEPVNVFEQELPARDFDPESYTVPQSAWYDGPAEGVIVRNKRGRRAKILHPAFREVDESVPVDAPAPELAARYATDRRIEKIATKLEDRERSVAFEPVYERVLEDIVREEHEQLYHGAGTVDLETFRSAVGQRVRQYLEDRRGQ